MIDGYYLAIDNGVLGQIIKSLNNQWKLSVE